MNNEKGRKVVSKSLFHFVKTHRQKERGRDVGNELESERERADFYIL